MAQGIILYKDDDGREMNLAIIKRLDPTRVYISHFKNMLFLMWIESHSDDWAEKRQATREIKICQRKLDYWARLYDHDRALVLMDEEKKKWKSEKGPAK